MNLFNHYKPVAFEKVRREEARRLTGLMKTVRPFSFLRLGDLELLYMIQCQKQQTKNPEWFDEEKTVSSNIVYGHPGLDLSHYPRLRRAYENGSFLDYHDGWRINQELLGELELNRPSEKWRNSSPETSQIFFDWLEHELPDYIRGRRVLMAGGEAGILKELYADPEYQKAFEGYWPSGSEIHFMGETRRHKTHLDEIKADLVDSVKKLKIDTLFLSMGGGAKILCHEIAEETGICTFDFGGLMRALTYSGSDGYAFYRAVHNPFLYRVPLKTYLKAIEKSYPSLSTSQLFSKAHAQLALELQTKEKGWSYAAENYGEDCFDPTGKNWDTYRESYRFYARELLPKARGDGEATRQVKEFNRWLWSHGIGWQAPFYRGFQKLKACWKGSALEK
jgi:hypothetical protein